MSRAPSASDRAYQQLIRCEFPPGAELREADVAEQLGLGRTPVREALGRLVHDGLVQVRPRQGYLVTPITLADVRAVFELRMILEPAAVELAVRRGAIGDLADLHDLAHVAEGSEAKEGPDAYLSAHLAFHVALARRSGNPRLADAIEQLLTAMERMLCLSVTHHETSGLNEHHRLYDALAAGDAARARRAMEEQIHRSREGVIQALVERLAGDEPLQTGALQLS
jgi:DNA-binding GntR family transcriptional regulator